MKRVALVLMLLTVISKIFGFGRDIILSYFYGTSYISDAYLISLTIPAIIFEFIGTALVTSYIPLYSKIEREESVESADRFTNNIISFIMIICILVTAGVFIFTVPIVKLFAIGFEGQTLKLAVSFSKITIFAIFFYALNYIFSGYLQLKHDFTTPALIGIPFNVFIILFIILSTKFNLLFLSIGKVIAVGAQFLFLIPFVCKKGYRYSLILEMKNEYVKRMILLTFPVIVGISVNQINVLVDRTMASGIASGGISSLLYADRVNDFVQGIFVMPIVVLLYPSISKMSAEGNIPGLKKSLSDSINLIILLVVPSVVATMIFAKSIISILYARGAFDSQAVSMTSVALFFYSGGMLGIGLREILSRVFYSLKDTKTPVINAAASLILNIILNIVLSRIWGIGGLALATSISAIFCSSMLCFSLRKKIGAFGIKNIIISFAKIIVASLIMGGASKLLYVILRGNLNESLTLLFSAVIGVIIYFVVINILKVEGADIVVSLFRKGVNKWKQART